MFEVCQLGEPNPPLRSPFGLAAYSHGRSTAVAAPPPFQHAHGVDPRPARRTTCGRTPCCLTSPRTPCAECRLRGPRPPSPVTTGSTSRATPAPSPTHRCTTCGRPPLLFGCAAPARGSAVLRFRAQPPGTCPRRACALPGVDVQQRFARRLRGSLATHINSPRLCSSAP